MVGWTIVMAGLVPAISFLKTLRDGTGIAGTTPGDDGLKRLLLLLLKICLDRTAELDRQWIAVAVLGLADFDPNPALRKARSTNGRAEPRLLATVFSARG